MPTSPKLNLANLLTSVRLLMVPWVVLSLLHGECMTAGALILFAGFTDAADGYVARRFQMESRLGAYLDPIADKCLLTAIYICFAVTRLVPPWLAWLVIGRDVVILILVAGAMLMTRHRTYPPSPWGKLSTGVQIIACLVFLSACFPNGWVSGAFLVGTQAAVAIVTAVSGIHYVARAILWAKEIP